MAEDTIGNGMAKTTEETEKAKKAVNSLESSVIKLGDSLNDLGLKLKKINEVQTLSSKGVEKTVQTYEYLDRKLKEIFKIQTKDDEITKITSTPYEKNYIRGLENYDKIKESATLVASETKKLSNGTRELVEIFKITNEEGTTTYKAINKKIIDVKKSLKDVNEEQKKNNNEQDKNNKKTSKFGILLERIKRIAVYRIIRRGLQIVTQTFTQSIQRLAQFDEKTNESVSQITSAFTKIQNAVGVAFVPILQSLAPVIDSISNSIVNFSNQLSLATAKLKGQDKYLKANTDYWKDYAKSIKNTNSQLLSFDKFEVLSSNKDGNIEDMFSEEVINGSEQVNSSIEDFAKTLQNLPSILSSIYGIASKIYKEIIEPLLPDITDFISGLIDIVAWIIKILDNTYGIKAVLGGIITFGIVTKITILIKKLGSIKALIGAIGIALTAMNLSKIFEQWGKWNDLSKTVVVGILAITVAITALAVAINAAAGNWGKAIAIGGIVTAAGTGVALGLGNLVSGYEQGGIPEKSELFYMNEYGKPEAMMSTNGQTNVINQDQLKFMTKEGFKEAIYETGLLDAMQERIILEGRNIDNNYVARGLFNALKVESTRRGGNQL